MHCSACGTLLADGKMRCAQCHHFTPGLWVNIYCITILIALSMANIFHIKYLVPVVQYLTVGLGIVSMPPVFLFYLQIAELTMRLLIPIVILAAIVLFVLRWKKVRISNAFRSGKLLAIVTWVALAYTLVGILSGYTEVLIIMPKLVK
jgi:ethanolamine transporter EutH